MHQNNSQAGDQLAERLSEWPGIHMNQIISAYWPINSEIDTRLYINKVCAQSQHIALPITNFNDHQMTFHLWHPELPLHTHDRSTEIMQPEDISPQVDPDIIIVPLLAFDHQGYRLGYGYGHYDRALQNIRLKKSVIAVGVGYNEQCVSNVPHDEHDQKLDYIVTPGKIYDCR